MDLKETVEKVNSQAFEALAAFHAGHPEKIGVCYVDIMSMIRNAFVEHKELVQEVCEAATTELTEDAYQEKLKEATAEPAKPAQTPGARAAQASGG